MCANRESDLPVGNIGIRTFEDTYSDVARIDAETALYFGRRYGAPIQRRGMPVALTSHRCDAD
jgi:hypothetical protein